MINQKYHHIIVKHKYKPICHKYLTMEVKDIEKRLGLNKLNSTEVDNRYCEDQSFSVDIDSRYCLSLLSSTTLNNIRYYSNKEYETHITSSETHLYDLGEGFLAEEISATPFLRVYDNMTYNVARNIEDDSKYYEVIE